MDFYLVLCLCASSFFLGFTVCRWHMTKQIGHVVTSVIRALTETGILKAMELPESNDPTS